MTKRDYNERAWTGDLVVRKTGAINVEALTRSHASHLFRHVLGIGTVSASAVGNLKQPALPYHPSTESPSIPRPQLYVKKISHAASITNKVLKSLAKRPGSHQISPPYSGTAFASPPFEPS
jgi:hypothetical protein